MRKRKRTNFDESLAANQNSYFEYYSRIYEIAVSMFEWDGLPDTVDALFMERALFEIGHAIFFRDEVIGLLCLRATLGGYLDLYDVPSERRAYASNGYNRALNSSNSVVIYNNIPRTNSIDMAKIYASRLWDIDRAIDVNARAQKTPVLLTGSTEQRLTLLNLYKEYDGNSPVIFGNKNISVDNLTCLKTDAPFVGDKLQQLKADIWNECLTWLGVPNLNIDKRERLITDEVARYQGGTIASRFSRLEARQQACNKINSMFGLDVKVSYRDFGEYRNASEGNTDV